MNPYNREKEPVKKLKKAIEDCDVTTTHKELLSLAKKDNACKEYVHEQIPDLLMSLRDKIKEDNYLTVKIISLFILYFKLNSEKLLLESLKRKISLLPEDDMTHLYILPKSITSEKKEYPVLDESRKELYNNLSDLISEMNLHMFFEVIWLSPPYSDMSDLSTELIKYPDKSLNKVLKDLVEKLLSETKPLSDEEFYSSPEFKKLSYLFTILFYRKDRENREYLIDLFETGKVTKREGIYPGPGEELIGHYVRHHINEDDYRAVRAFFKEIFSGSEIIRNFLTGFVEDQDFISNVDFDKIAPPATSFITETFK